jgi:glycosyltransferase involved in cell wall biosynthesis
MTDLSLEPITPVVLTYNEDTNIGRTLDSLQWAADIVVVDSGSTDETESIARSFPNVRWRVRPFDTHLAQWSFAISETGIATEYILALDADMQVTPSLVEELQKTFLPGRFAGGITRFEYRYHGYALLGSLCPPQLRLFRRAEVSVAQPDHTQRFSIAGDAYRFRSALIHDDRKPIERWVTAQLAYRLLNERDLSKGGRRRLRDHLRNAGVMPPIMGLLAYLRAGGPFKGAAAARYAYERMTAETLLAIGLLDDRLKKSSGSRESDARIGADTAEVRKSNVVNR